MIAAEQDRHDSAVGTEFEKPFKHFLRMITAAEMKLFEGVAVEDGGLGGTEQRHDLGGITNEGRRMSEMEI